MESSQNRNGDVAGKFGDRRVVIELPSDVETGFNFVAKSIFLAPKLQKLDWSRVSKMKENMESIIYELNNNN